MRLIDKIALGLLLAGVLISTGCGSDKYPTEMSLEDAPDIISEAFKEEKDADIKAMATQSVQLLTAKNYTAAHGVLNQLLSVPSLAKEQRDLLSGALMTVAKKLNQAAEQGNPQADQYLKQRSFGK
jgi:hypothetical protein